VDRRTVELRIAGQSYRVVSSAPEEDLRRLAQVVGAKLAEVVPKGRPVPPQAMLLAAMALAHEVETVRGEREVLERRTRDLLRRAMIRIDDALEPFKDAGDASEVREE
jgi:cell division protein ZapA